jgi:hypothetical protein
LWRHGRLKIPIEACRVIGAAVAAHLKVAGWRLHRKPPDPPHSAGGAKNQSGGQTDG